MEWTPAWLRQESPCKHSPTRVHTEGRRKVSAYVRLGTNNISMLYMLNKLTHAGDDAPALCSFTGGLNIVFFKYFILKK